MNTNPKRFDTLVTIRLPSNLLEKLSKYSANKECTVSAAVRRAIRELVKEDK